MTKQIESIRPETLTEAELEMVQGGFVGFVGFSPFVYRPFFYRPVGVVSVGVWGKW